MNSIKEKPNTLHGNNKKAVLRASQESLGPCPAQAQGVKVKYSFERQSFEKKGLRSSQGHPGYCFPGFISPGAANQAIRATAAMVKRGLETAVLAELVIIHMVLVLQE